MVLYLYESHSAKTEHKCTKSKIFATVFIEPIFKFTSHSTKIRHCTVIMPLLYIKKKTKEERGRCGKRKKK
jgi:hypothetical protein